MWTLRIRKTVCVGVLLSVKEMEFTVYITCVFNIVVLIMASFKNIRSGLMLGYGNGFIMYDAYTFNNLPSPIKLIISFHSKPKINMTVLLIFVWRKTIYQCCVRH